ncbi:AraC family transcriptional regulator N-terminal domain-containing protein [Rossellomorea vietnamensis]
MLDAVSRLAHLLDTQIDIKVHYLLIMKEIIYRVSARRT